MLPKAFSVENISVGSKEPYGIIHELRYKYFVDISQNVVASTNFLEERLPPQNVIDHKEFYTGADKTAYWQVEFKDSYVFPTHYSIRGFQDAHYPREWTIYGFNKIGDTPIQLSADENYGSTFCGVGNCGEHNDRCCANWATFPIKSQAAYRYYRMVGRVFNYPDYPRIAISGFEIFGVYSRDGRVIYEREPQCFTKNKNNNNYGGNVLSNFTNLFLVMLFLISEPFPLILKSKISLEFD